MVPHSYTFDSLSKSQDLASAISAATSPPQILSLCASIDSYLHSLPPDHSRHFFSLTFPSLLCHLFGFNDAVPWLQLPDRDLASRILHLLHPSSPLLRSIAAVDRLSLVHYVFPLERLPQWSRFLLQNGKDSWVLGDVCLLFKGRIKEDPLKPSSLQVRLNVFEYYIFWFAYYAVCRGNGEDPGSGPVNRSRKFRLENWASSIPGLAGSAKRGSEQKTESNLYTRLLYAYLKFYVPCYDLNAHQPYRSSLLHYGSGYDGSGMQQAEFLVNTLVHFWLVENDFSPVPVTVCKSFGVSFPFGSLLGEIPPVAGLGEVVNILVKYLNLSSVVAAAGSETAEFSGNTRWGVSGQVEAVKSRDVVGSWNSLIQRPLYRYLLRTFLFCPMGTSMKNASQVFAVWVSYLEPWSITVDDFAALESSVDNVGSQNDGTKEKGESQVRGYSSSWQGYVLCNYLYYSSLVMHFIGFAHKFLHTDPEVVVQMLRKVLDVLTASGELTNLIRSVDTLFHQRQAGSGKSLANTINRYIPSIREQLQDWEHGLCESDADGSFLHENWNKDLRLFSDGEDGGQHLLQLFILRAESEIHTVSGQNMTQNLQCLNSLKEKVACLFGSTAVKPIFVTPEAKQHCESRDELFTPRNAGNRTSPDIKYKGDWMKRPISDEEVAWLARLFIRLSAWLNETLGLNQADNGQTGSSCSYVDISGVVNGNVSGTPETMKVVSSAIGSGLLVMGTASLGLMRKHGVRVNLRIFASKKLVMVLLLSVLFSVVRKAFGLFYSA